MFISEKEKQVMRILEGLEIAAACPRCGCLSMEIWSGSNKCPHCEKNTEDLAVSMGGAASSSLAELEEIKEVKRIAWTIASEEYTKACIDHGRAEMDAKED